MRSVFVALAVASILVFGAAGASAGVQNVPIECQGGIGQVGFDTGSRAQYAIVKRLFHVEFGADFHRANEFIDAVVRTVLSAQPSFTVETNAFLGCRFVGMVDGATRAISDIAADQIVACANEGVNLGKDLAKLNCALVEVVQQRSVATSAKSYAVIDIECSININLGCFAGFEQYVRDNRFSTCIELAHNPSLATFIKTTGCNIP